jgi:hypothetical protein
MVREGQEGRKEGRKEASKQASKLERKEHRSIGWEGAREDGCSDHGC